MFITHSVEEAGRPLRSRAGDVALAREVVEELRIDIPRPRTLGEDRALEEYSRSIYAHFARLGVIHRDPREGGDP